MSIYVYVLNHNAVGFSLSTFEDRFQIDQIRHIPYDDAGGVWEACLLTKETDRKNAFYGMLKRLQISQMCKLRKRCLNLARADAEQIFAGLRRRNAGILCVFQVFATQSRRKFADRRRRRSGLTSVSFRITPLPI